MSIFWVLYGSFFTYVTLESVDKFNRWNQFSYKPITINLEIIKPIMAYAFVTDGALLYYVHKFDPTFRF